MSGGDSQSGDIDSPIRVVVTPSQSSYFAGEPFSVSITFTNTRSAESLPIRLQSHTHKRGAHSISSAPLARPPTSPGTPRTAIPTTPTRGQSGETKISRRGFIGKGPPPKGADELPDVLEQSRKRLLAKSRSLSVNVIPHEVLPELKSDPSIYVRAYDEVASPSTTPISPQAQSPFGRSPSLPRNHPHARKQSVFDGHIPFPEPPQQSPISSPYPSSASNSAFSLSLDPISESASSPFPASIPTTPSTSVYLNSQQLSTSQMQLQSQPPHRPSHIGLGHGPPPSSLPNSHPRTAFTSGFPQPNTELILYSYAQLTGTLSVTPIPGAVTTQEQINTLNSLRSNLLKRSVVGGGSMDITSSLHSGNSRSSLPSSRRPHKRSSSFSAGLLSFISTPSPPVSAPNLTSTSTPSLLPPSQSWSPSHRPRTYSQSMLSGIMSPSLSAPGLANTSGATVVDEFDPETLLPTFEVPQVMLAVDLSLGPGESRTYNYKLPLPDNLPPTFKGRSLKFSYQFIVGTCRAGSVPSPPGPGKSPGPTSASSVSRVMKVPIRVYNNVFVGRPQRPYDLLWPVAKRRHMTLIHGAKVTEEKSKKMEVTLPSKISPPSNFGTYVDLQEYARRLLASLPEPDAKGERTRFPVEAFSPDRSDLERELERDDDGVLTGCREAVEILTRNPKKVSYDVNKDGVKVAVLTFTKSAYRLGETILGVVELNERTSRAKVLSLSAILEAHESLPSSISSASASRQMRRVHAEHHSSFVLSSLRTTFSLDIPSDASPAFQVKIGEKAASLSGGLEWKVRLCLLVAVAVDSSVAGPEGVRMKHLIRDGPRGEWGSSWKAGASIAPMELVPRDSQKDQTPQTQTWGQFFATTILGGVEDGDDDESTQVDGMWDGDGDGEDQRDYGGGDEGWKQLKVETVECEVPIKVWPGNTAFKATDVVFDV